MQSTTALDSREPFVTELSYLSFSSHLSFPPPFVWLSLLIFSGSFQLGYYIADLNSAVKLNNA